MVGAGTASDAQGWMVYRVFPGGLWGYSHVQPCTVLRPTTRFSTRVGSFLTESAVRLSRVRPVVGRGPRIADLHSRESRLIHGSVPVTNVTRASPSRVVTTEGDGRAALARARCRIDPSPPKRPKRSAMNCFLAS